MELAGTVFDIQRFATKDGPGIRTLVFMKGCPLSCYWCANPESHNQNPEIVYYVNKCSGCVKCIALCPEKAIRRDPEYGLLTDTSKCTACGICSKNCFYDARRLLGSQYSVSELFGEIMKDEAFYRDSGGGVTFSGGEPLLQADFISEVASKCKAREQHVALETCGFVPWESFQKVLPHLDLVFFDYKHFDPVEHKMGTGVDNRRILDNLKSVSRSGKDLVVRIPVIPGFNFDRVVLEKMFSFLATFKSLSAVELLPYHRLGSSKYGGLGRVYRLQGVEAVKPEQLEEFLEIGISLDLPVRIGTK